MAKINNNNEFGEKFAKAFQDVVMPVLEDMHSGIKSLEKRLDNVEEDLSYLKTRRDKTDMHLESIGRTLVRIEDRLDRYDKRLDHNEKRIGKLEAKAKIVL